jgi:hypothetical protein
MKDTVSHYVPPHSPLTSTEPQVFSNNLTMPPEDRRSEPGADLPQARHQDARRTRPHHRRPLSRTDARSPATPLRGIAGDTDLTRLLDALAVNSDGAGVVSTGKTPPGCGYIDDPQQSSKARSAPQHGPITDRSPIIRISHQTPSVAGGHRARQAATHRKTVLSIRFHRFVGGATIWSASDQAANQTSNGGGPPIPVALSGWARRALRTTPVVHVRFAAVSADTITGHARPPY